MLIESDARRYIIKAIELEKEIAGFEVRERLKGFYNYQVKFF
jgi:hypothetical protein